MANLNKAMIIGRLGQDPELKNNDGTNPVCNFSVATNETWKDKTTGEKVERTEWHNIVIWGRLAEVASQYLRSGSQVYLEGKMQTRSWEDDNGTKRYKTEVVANKMEFMDSKSNETHEPEASPAMDSLSNARAKFETNDQRSDNATKDDIPF